MNQELAYQFAPLTAPPYGCGGAQKRSLWLSGPLLSAAVLYILLAILVLEPVLVLLAVGHGGPFEGLSCSNLLIGQSLSIC